MLYQANGLEKIIEQFIGMDDAVGLDRENLQKLFPLGIVNLPDFLGQDRAGLEFLYVVVALPKTFFLNLQKLLTFFYAPFLA